MAVSVLPEDLAVAVHVGRQVHRRHPEYVGVLVARRDPRREADVSLCRPPSPAPVRVKPWGRGRAGWGTDELPEVMLAPTSVPFA